MVDNHASSLGITRREYEVLTLVASGLNTHAVAARLFISKYTVRTHITNAMRKMEVRTRTHAACLVAVHNATHGRSFTDGDPSSGDSPDERVDVDEVLGTFG